MVAMIFALPEHAGAQAVVGGQCGRCGRWYIGTHNCPYAGGSGGTSGSSPRRTGGGGGSGTSRGSETPRWRLAALDCNRSGIRAYNEENWDHAVYYFELAHSHDPNDNVISQNLQNARQQQGWARERTQRNEKISHYRGLARDAEKRGDYNAAEWYLQQGHDLYPFESSLVYALRDIREKREEAERKAAKTRLEIAIALQIEEARAQERAEAYAKDMAREAKAAANRGDLKSAIVFLEGGLQVAQEHAGLKSMLAEARKRQAEQKITQEQQEKIRSILVTGVQGFKGSVGSGLEFGPVPSAVSSPGGRAELGFPGIDAPRTLFDKGSVGSPPVSVPEKTPTKPASEAATKSLSIQITAGRFSLPGLPAPLVSVRGSGMMNPLDEGLKERDRKLLSPPDISKLAKFSDKEREDYLQEREEAALREALRQSSADMTEVMKKLEQLAILRPGEPLLKQLSDPKIAAQVEAAIQPITKRELQRQQEAHMEIRHLREMCQLEKAAHDEEVRRSMARITTRMKEIEKRISDQEFDEWFSMKQLRHIDREEYLNDLRKTGVSYFRGDFSYEELVRRAKTEPGIRVWIKPLQDMEEVWAQDEKALHARYDKLLAEQIAQMLREGAWRRQPPSP